MKKALLFSTLIIVSISINAQTHTWLWANDNGGKGVGNGVALDASGNSYVTGFCTTGVPVFSNDTIASGGFLVKYDGTGGLAWATTWAPGPYFYAYTGSVVADAGGNTYIAGTDVGFIQKYNSQGQLVWIDSLVSDGNNVNTNAIALDEKGNIYAAGPYAGNIVIGGNALNLAFDAFFITKCNNAGKVIWAKQSQGHVFGISADAAGNAYLTGYTRFSNYNQFIISKYDTSGTLLWTQSAGGTTNGAEGFAITTDANGNSYVTGSFTDNNIYFDNMGLINPDSPASDGFAVKYDSSGKVIWAHKFGGLGYEYGYGITRDAKQNIFITGTASTPTSFQFANTTVGGGVLVLSYDSSGTERWVTTSTGDGEGHAIAVDENENCVITGFFYNDTLTFGSTTLSSIYPTGQKYFAAKTGPIATQVVNINSVNNLSIYPNPTSSSFIIETTGTDAPPDGRAGRQLQLFDMAGKLLLSQSIYNTKTNIDASQLSAGIYLVSVKSGEGVATQKLSVVK